MSFSCIWCDSEVDEYDGFCDACKDKCKKSFIYDMFFTVIFRNIKNPNEVEKISIDLIRSISLNFDNFVTTLNWISTMIGTKKRK